MSGTIPLSLTQQLDEFGKPLGGGKLYIIQAGTVSTPQDSFQDPALTPALKLPNPITLDAAGRLPQFFLADGFIKIRLTDSAGIVQREADSIQVIGPSGGGGGGAGAVDPNALIQTGNMIARYGVGSLAGYVRLNGLTMGNANSGANERANADCQPLWIYLYGVDPTLPVSGGRTGNALNDFNANKTIQIPDWRGYALGALDDMGNVPSGRLTATFFGNSPTILGNFGGNQAIGLTAAQLPVITPTGTVTVSNGAINASLAGPVIVPGQGVGVGGGGAFGITGGPGINVSQGASSATFTGNSFGGGQNHATIGPRKLCTFYLKL